MIVTCTGSCPNTEFVPGVWRDHMHRCFFPESDQHEDHRCACGAAWSAQCRYMAAAYPDLDARDTCDPFDHRHDEPTFALACELAARVHECDPDDEQIAWFLNDAGAVVDDFMPAPASWNVSPLVESQEHGVDFTLTINDVPYVIPVSGHKEESHPVSLAEWRSWGHEADDE